MLFGERFRVEQTCVLGVPTVSLSPLDERSSSVGTILRLLCPRGDSAVQYFIEWVLMAGFVTALAAFIFSVVSPGLAGTVFTR